MKKSFFNCGTTQDNEGQVYLKTLVLKGFHVQRVLIVYNDEFVLYTGGDRDNAIRRKRF